MSELIQKKIRQYLVHSFLYYQLDESIIADSHYDQICKEVLKLLKNQTSPSILPYEELVKKTLFEDASGFSIKQYPAEIISSAFHLLYQHNGVESTTFDSFLARFGYTISDTIYA